jgi:hypothetical protein
MNNFNVLIAGCSFSEAYVNNPWYSWSLLAEDYLKEKLGNNYKITQSAKSSAGQTKITDTIFSNVLINNIEYDLVLIQWSAFSRVFGKTERDALFNMYKHFIAGEDKYLINLYGTEYTAGEFLDFVEDDIIKQSLMKILLTKYFLKDKNIDYKMWFGWQQIYPEQINQNKVLVKLLEELINDENFIFFKHDDKYDYELPNYLKCGKGTYQSALKKMFNTPTKDFFWPGSEFGGMTEYIRENLEEGKYNRKDPNVIDDQHPSSLAHKVFFEGFIKPILDEKIKSWKEKKNII